MYFELVAELMTPLLLSVLPATILLRWLGAIFIRLTRPKATYDSSPSRVICRQRMACGGRRRQQGIGVVHVNHRQVTLRAVNQVAKAIGQLVMHGNDAILVNDQISIRHVF